MDILCFIVESVFSVQATSSIITSVGRWRNHLNTGKKFHESIGEKKRGDGAVA